MENLVVFSIGAIAQILFGARILIQWILSEKAKKVLAPTIFWILSIVGSYLFFIYGWLRSDFAILTGQFVSYYIYLWNINQKKLWEKVAPILKVLLLVTPFVATGLAVAQGGSFVDSFLTNKDIPLWLVLFGCMGQLVFAFRFVYQWRYSSKRKDSLLPMGFWILSIVGASTILIYAIIRKDPVLIFGQTFGFIAYSRNIFLSKKKLN